MKRRLPRYLSTRAVGLNRASHGREIVDSWFSGSDAYRVGTGRPRTFDESEALSRVMESFWRRGYEATTFEHLVADTGLSRSSLYNAFGGKDKLLARALDLYVEREQSEFFATLTDPETGPDALLSLVDSLSEPYNPKARGCLLQKIVLRNAAAGGKPKLERRIAKVLGNLWGSVTDALSGIRRKRRRLTNEQRGAIVVACLFGISVIARNGRNPELVESISSALRAICESD